MIIGISGYMGSGKDTIASIIQYYGILRKDYSWSIKKFSFKMKKIASILTGIPEEKFEDQEFKKQPLSRDWTYPIDFSNEEKWVEMTVREFLQKLGTEAIRNSLHENAWVNALFADYRPLPSKITKDFDGTMHSIPYPKEEIVYPNWIITDVRFPNEAQAIKNRGGIVIRVNRKPEGDWGILKEYYVEKHPSEISLDDWEFDYVINNSGTIDELVEKVENMLLQLNIIN